MTKTAKTLGAYIKGLDALPVAVEACVEEGLPGIFITGVSDCLEVSQRVRCALKSSGFEVPTRVQVIIEPSFEKRIASSTIDLAIAAAILAASGQIPLNECAGRLYYGSVDIAGRITSKRGVYCASKLAAQMDRVLVARIGSEKLHSGCNYSDIRTLEELHRAPIRQAMPFAPADDGDLWTQELFSRGEVIAAAGKLGAVIVGEGVNSLTFSRHVRALMPPMDECEWDCIDSAYSIIGESAPAGRPVRKINHAESLAGIIGGGVPILPGESTLASGGVLMVGEVTMLPQATISALRCIFGDRQVRIVRSNGRYVLPADCILVSDVGGIHCGLVPSDYSQAYRKNALDRAKGIADIAIEANDPAYSYEQARSLVATAWDILREHPRPSDALDRIAQTVAALDGCEQPEANHLLEARKLSLDSLI